MKTFTSAVTAAIVLISAGLAPASVYNFSLDGLQEVPPNASPAFGSISLTVDDLTFDWTLSGTFQDLLSSATAAHIHKAPPGVNGPVIFPLTVTAATSGTVSGAGTFTAAQLADLIDGQYYVNIHSSTFPGGEIRGQVVPEPSTLLLLALTAIPLLRRH